MADAKGAGRLRRRIGAPASEREASARHGGRRRRHSDRSRLPIVSGLHQCIDEKRYRQFRYLLRAQTVFRDARDASGLTPLLRCCTLDDESLAVGLVRALLDSGAKATLKDRDGLSALHYACKLGKLKLVQLLLRRVIDLGVGEADAFGNTALHYAAASGDADLLRLVLARCHREGVDVDRRNALGFSPLLLAASNGRLEAARLLVEGGGASTTMRDDVHFRSAPEWLAIWRSGDGEAAPAAADDDGARMGVRAVEGRRRRPHGETTTPQPHRAGGGINVLRWLSPPSTTASSSRTTGTASRTAAAAAGLCTLRSGAEPSRPCDSTVSRQRIGRCGGVRAGVVMDSSDAAAAAAADESAEAAQPEQPTASAVVAAPPPPQSPTSWQMLSDWTLVLYKQLSPSYRKPAALPPPASRGHATDQRRQTVQPSKTGRQKYVAATSLTASVAASESGYGGDDSRPPPALKARPYAMTNITSHYRLQLPADAASDGHYARSL